MSRKRLWLAIAIGASTVAIFGGWTLSRVRHALGEARARVASESVIQVTARPLQNALPTGLEFVGAPAVFADAQVFHGHLFIAGPAGLAEHDNNGTLIARYRVGAELPSAPVTALAVGLAGDSKAPELWIGTAGEG